MAQMSSTNTTYKMSFKKIARAAMAEMRVHKKLVIITFVLYGVALLLFLFNSEVYVAHYDERKRMVFHSSEWGLFFAVFGAVVGYFSALNVFRDMNNQQICDVSMALPIRASERFLSKLLCLFYIQILPLLVSVLGGNGVIYLIGRIRFGDLPSNAGEDIIKLALAFLAAVMFAMSIVVLCVCCCGAPAESSYFSIILMGIINGMPFAFVYNMIMRCGGFANSLYFFDKIDLGYWGFLFILTEDMMIPHCAVGCVISLAVMLLSGLIYVRRDAKTVGMPIASRVFFEVIMALGCVTVFIPFAMSDPALWGLLVAAVAYIIINVIVSRAKINALSFLKWSGKYLITAAAFTVVLVAAIKTGGFGYIHERPAAEYLDGAKFSITYYDAREPNPYEQYSYARELCTDVLTPEQADKVMSICKKHMANGVSKISPFSVILDAFSSDDISYINVRAESNIMYDECPYPRSQFEARGYANREKYYLYYRQYLHVPAEDARAMAEELKALDFVYEYNPSVKDTTTYYN